MKAALELSRHCCYTWHDQAAILKCMLPGSQRDATEAARLNACCTICYSSSCFAFSLMFVSCLKAWQVARHGISGSHMPHMHLEGTCYSLVCSCSRAGHGIDVLPSWQLHVGCQEWQLSPQLAHILARNAATHTPQLPCRYQLPCQHPSSSTAAVATHWVTANGFGIFYLCKSRPYLGTLDALAQQCLPEPSYIANLY